MELASSSNLSVNIKANINVIHEIVHREHENAPKCCFYLLCKSKMTKRHEIRIFFQNSLTRNDQVYLENRLTATAFKNNYFQVGSEELH